MRDADVVFPACPGARRAARGADAGVPGEQGDRGGHRPRDGRRADRSGGADRRAWAPRSAGAAAGHGGRAAAPGARVRDPRPARQRHRRAAACTGRERHTRGPARGRPPGVPAPAPLPRLFNDTVVPLPAGGAKGTPAAAAAGVLPAGQRPRGAVPPASKLPRLNLGARAARGHDRLRTMRPPAPAPVSGFNTQTSRLEAAGTSATQEVYQNADGTKTAMIYQAPVNYRQPDGSWARINTSLIPAGSQGAATVTPSPDASHVPSSPPPLTSPSPVLVTPTLVSPPASGPASATPSLASSAPAPPTPTPDAVPSSASASSSAPIPAC